MSSRFAGATFPVVFQGLNDEGFFLVGTGRSDHFDRIAAPDGGYRPVKVIDQDPVRVSRIGDDGGDVEVVAVIAWRAVPQAR